MQTVYIVKIESPPIGSPEEKKLIKAAIVDAELGRLFHPLSLSAPDYN
jgi:hypothetical protein